jgi:hypothetical protein
VVTVARLADRTGVLGNPFGWLLLPEKVRSETIAARRQNRTDFDLASLIRQGEGWSQVQILPLRPEKPLK